MNILWQLQLAFLADDEGPGMLMILGPIALIWIFLVILPGRKEKKRKAEMLDNLKKGDRVLVQAGCIGKVVQTTGELVTLDFDGARIKFLRNTVIKIIDKDGGDVTATS